MNEFYPSRLLNSTSLRGQVFKASHFGLKFWKFENCRWTIWPVADFAKKNSAAEIKQIVLNVAKGGKEAVWSDDIEQNDALFQICV